CSVNIVFHKMAEAISPLARLVLLTVFRRFRPAKVSAGVDEWLSKEWVRDCQARFCKNVKTAGSGVI
ncbi:hypothetical protein, partial [Terrihabitans sp. B22-R8]|uniref:hypothetical protein n=1 Tax=Terrihabitans sp. B22-R8 TaxID=3425128 RepID=UPI00403C65EA